MMRKKALLALLFITPFAIFYGQKFLLSEKNVQLNYQTVKEKALLVSNEWLNPSWGKRELEQNCPSLFQKMSQVDERYLRCNPEYLKCRFKDTGKAWKVDFFSEKFPQLGYSPVFKSLSHNTSYPSKGLEMALVINDQRQMIFLENECRKVYLPQRRYLYLHSDIKEKWYWDNFKRFIYIDQYMVRNQEVKEWQIVTGQAVQSELKTYAPATHLSLSEMKNYCSFVGGHLLQAHIYDAAAVYPKQPNDPKPDSITVGPFPWTTKRMSEELFLFQKNPKRPFKIEKICAHMNSQECSQFHQILYSNQAFSSWSDMSDIMNGVSEVLDNPIEPEKNVVFFDQQLSSASPYFQLGKRIHWDEQEKEERNFPELESFPEFKWPLPLGFRCMYYSWEKATP